MKIKLFNNKIQPACMHCRFGKRNGDSAKVFCEKKGIVDAFSSCRRYDYDPLKRVPKKVDFETDLSKEDFEI